jgi:hypothetical protein
MTSLLESSLLSYSNAHFVKIIFLKNFELFFINNIAERLLLFWQNEFLIVDAFLADYLKFIFSFESSSELETESSY